MTKAAGIDGASAGGVHAESAPGRAPADSALQRRFARALDGRDSRQPGSSSSGPHAYGAVHCAETSVRDERLSDRFGLSYVHAGLSGAPMHLGAPSETAQPGPQRDATSTASFKADELVALLERVCSGMYVGDPHPAQHRVLLALDGALPGAAAEIVRDGMHLTVRLHARNEAAYRVMLAQRETLSRALESRASQSVTIAVVPNGELGRVERG